MVAKPFTSGFPQGHCQPLLLTEEKGLPGRFQGSSLIEALEAVLGWGDKVVSVHFYS